MRMAFFRFSALACTLLSCMLAVGSSIAAGADTAATAEELLLRVEHFLDQQAEHYPGSVKISVESARGLDDAPCASPDISLPTGHRLRARMNVALRCMSPKPWSATVQATVAIHGFFYVASRDLEPGHTLSLFDLIPREADIMTLPRGTIVDPSQLVDHIITQRVRAGTPLKARAVRSPDSIQRGQIVKVEAHGPGFIAASEGRALQDGLPGEQIRVRTPSGRVISATVTSATTVMVTL